MKNFASLMLFAGLTSVGLVMGSCSATDEPDEPILKSDKEIRFTANTEFSRVVGDITTNSLKTFNVFAYTGSGTSPDLFMNNVVVTKTTTNTWTYSPVQYWPSKSSVDFYAFAPAGWIGSSNPLSPIAYDAYPGTQDIIYATSPDMTGAAGSANAQVLFNFRHALSKITVKMSSTNTNLTVKVTNVALSHMMSKGNFHFPSGSTADAPGLHTVGTWTDQNTPLPYIMHMSQTPGDIIILSSTATDMGTTTTPGARYMIPQPLVWNNNGGEADTYIAVMCSVYDTASGTKLWPNENTPKDNIVDGSTYGDGLLKFPLSTSTIHEWRAGVHYIYNLVINSNEDMGAIEFGAPAVESYVDVETTYQ